MFLKLKHRWDVQKYFCITKKSKTSLKNHNYFCVTKKSKTSLDEHKYFCIRKKKVKSHWRIIIVFVLQKKVKCYWISINIFVLQKIIIILVYKRNITQGIKDDHLSWTKFIASMLGSLFLWHKKKYNWWNYWPWLLYQWIHSFFIHWMMVIVLTFIIHQIVINIFVLQRKTLIQQMMIIFVTLGISWNVYHDLTTINALIYWIMMMWRWILRQKRKWWSWKMDNYFCGRKNKKLINTD